MYCVEVGLSTCCSHQTHKRCLTDILFFPTASILVFTRTKAVDRGRVPFGRVLFSLPIRLLDGGEDGIYKASYHCKVML